MSVKFEIDYLRCLDRNGAVVGALPNAAEDPEFAKRLYRALIRARSFDAKAIALQRTGRLGTFASALGQEAVSLGAASAMRPEDVFVPSFREHAGQLWRGVSLLELFLYWGGDERGSDFKGPRERLSDRGARRHPCATRGGRGARFQAATRGSRGAVHLRRRRDLEGRRGRGAQLRGGLAAAGWYSSSAIINGRYRFRCIDRPPQRHWRRKRSLPGFPVGRSTATTC